MYNLIKKTHPQWHPLLEDALKSVDPSYLHHLEHNLNWLPGKDSLLAAFSRSVDDLRYILLGESPYPRAQSANGYAFWDANVGSLWSEKGLSKEVNRATSLRNIIKMLLLARGDLSLDLSQQAIAQLDKTHYMQTASQLFMTMIDKGFLLLNASLVYSDSEVPFHAKHWQPFISSVFAQLAAMKHPVQLILLGRIAKQVPDVNLPVCLLSEHPYNLSFITNEDVLNFFKPLDLLSCHD